MHYSSDQTMTATFVMEDSSFTELQKRNQTAASDEMLAVCPLSLSPLQSPRDPIDSLDDSVADWTETVEANEAASSPGKKKSPWKKSSKKKSPKTLLFCPKKKSPKKKSPKKTRPRNPIPSGPLEACSSKCSKKCATKFSAAERMEIFNKFQSFDWHGKQAFYGRHVHKLANDPIRKRKTQRRWYSYFLPKNDSESLEVCQKFYSSTIGKERNACNAILSTVKSVKKGVVTKEPQGKWNRPTVKRDLVHDHIMTFKPQISHYKRKNCPLRRYLPSNQNISRMHKDFLQKHPGQEVSYRLYGHVLRKQMKISMKDTTNEKCGDCVKNELHKKESCNESSDCEKCLIYDKHHKAYILSKQLYDKDVELAKEDQSLAVLTGDMKKVDCLPDVPKLQEAFFCSGLVCYNETFTPVRKTCPFWRGLNVCFTRFSVIPISNL